MRHPPFDSYITIDETELTPDQAAALQAHLQACEDCRSFQQDWAAARSLIVSAPLASPAPGFSQRWRSSLVERRRLQQQRQVHRLLGILIIGATVAMLAFIGFLSSTMSLADLAVAIFQTAAHLIVRWNDTQQVFLPVLQALPPIVPIALWILVTSTISILAMVWAVAVWRISIQGVIAK